MQHWVKYLREEEGKEVLTVKDKGLLAYYDFGHEFLLSDLFVVPEERNSKIALNLSTRVQAIAEGKGVKRMIAQIHISKNNKEMFPRKVKLFSKFGFVVDNANNNIITMIKELGD